MRNMYSKLTLIRHAWLESLPWLRHSPLPFPPSNASRTLKRNHATKSGAGRVRPLSCMALTRFDLTRFLLTFPHLSFHQAAAASSPTVQPSDVPVIDLVQQKRGVLWVTDLTSAEWCSLQQAFQISTGKPKETTEIMKTGTAVHAKMEEELVKRVEVEVTSREDRRGVKVIAMITQLSQLLTDGKTREVEMFARLRPQDPWLFGKLDEVYLVDCPSMEASSSTVPPLPPFVPPPPPPPSDVEDQETASEKKSKRRKKLTKSQSSSSSAAAAASSLSSNPNSNPNSNNPSDPHQTTGGYSLSVLDQVSREMTRGKVRPVMSPVIMSPVKSASHPCHVHWSGG